MNDSLDCIEGPYLRDLLDQPAALRSAWQHRKQSGPSAALRRAIDASRGQPIVLTGMGSSFYALYPLYLRLVSYGLQVNLAETSELIHYVPKLVDKDSLMIALSQSGRSAETLKLLEIAGRKCTLIGVTNSEVSPLAKTSAATVLIHAGKESSVSCKTYLTSLLTLAWLGTLLTGENEDRMLRDLESAETATSAYLAMWRTHVVFLSDLLRNVSTVFLTGRGPSLAAAQTGGLIIKESVRFASEGMSSAAFRHGPFEVVSPQVFVAILGGDQRTFALNQNLAHNVREAGGQAALIYPESNEEAFRLPVVPGDVLPIVEILPLQMISLALAHIGGREPGLFEHARKITETE